MRDTLSRYFFLIILIPLLVLFLSLNFISYNYTTYLWFESLHQTDIWWKSWIKEIQFYFIGVILSVILYYASGIPGIWRIRNRFGGGSVPQYVRVLAYILPLFFALVLHGPAMSSLWDEYVLAAHSSEFGIVDPLFQRDASFYMFDLDLYSGLYGWFKVQFVFLGLYSLALYLPLLRGYDPSRDLRRLQQVINFGFSHLMIIAGLFVLTVALESYLGRFTLLFEGGSDKLAGASYTDVNARALAYTIFFFLGVGLSLLIVVSSFLRNWKIPAASAGIWFLSYIVLLRIYPAAVQSISVNPNELNAEKPYIEHSIRFTRLGYGLDTVNQMQFNAADTVTGRDLNSHPTIVKNIRLWDYRPLLDTYSQLQEIKPYYEFSNVDIDRYRVNGELRQVMISARELNANELPSRARSWIQTKLQYTHGYGVVMSPSNRFTPAGLPELWIKDFPPRAIKGLTEIKRPGIYYGELTDDYAVVNSAMQEIDYPQEQGFAQTQYRGSGGIVLGSGLRKFLISWQFDTWKLLVSREIKEDSRILLNRQIHRAVRSLAPFLRFDTDPYIVVGDDGRLYWIMDAYTASEKFPYSRRFDHDIYSRVNRASRSDPFRQFNGINYIRNSVKVVIDAYDGTITLYRFDHNDPVLRAWSAFFPGLFRDIEQMPPDLRRHLRYPETLFLIQAGIYTDYHMTDYQAFYNREDRWEIATELYSGKDRRVEPYYTVIRLPEEKKEEYILMLPFVPKGKRNLIAWMAARCDYPAKEGLKDSHYGELLLLDFPRTRQFYGPMQIESRINQDPDISRDLTLWDQKGSRVIRGNLLVIPIGRSLLYIEPVYLQSTNSPFPELKRVVAADSRTVVMRETLGEALLALTRADPGKPRQAGENEPLLRSPQEILNGARNALRRARRAAGEGKWEEFGKNMRELEDLLGRLSQN